MPTPRLLPLSLAAALGCGAHLHRPSDAASAEGADTELKAAQLVDGFAGELGQSAAIAADELEAARAWAVASRDRDLLDVLAATDEADPDTERLLHPRCRGRFTGDGWPTLCSKIGARLQELTGANLPAPEGAPPAAARPRRGPEPPAPTADPAADLLRELRRVQHHFKGPASGEARLGRAISEYNLGARALHLGGLAAPAPTCPTLDLHAIPAELRGAHDRLRVRCGERRASLRQVVERAPASELGAAAERALAVHDALVQHHDDLARRLFAYDVARRPCTEGPAPTLLPLSTGAAAAPPASAPPASAPRPAARAPVLGLPLGAGLLDHGRWLQVAAPAPLPACDEPALRERLVALGGAYAGPALARFDLAPLGRLGRLYQLEEQLAALDALIEERQLRPTRADTPPAALGKAPPYARVIHQTIEGIDRVQQVIDAFEITVLTLLRETLRVERDDLLAARAHAERRVRIELARIGAQLDEATLLLDAMTRLGALGRAGCTQQPLAAAHEAPRCRDELTKVLIAFAGAWTLGRAAQKQADALDLATRHDASVARSRSAMALRQVLLAAGVAELVKFNRGGISPEALAQLIVSAVGFATVTGAVLVK